MIMFLSFLSGFGKKRFKYVSLCTVRLFGCFILLMAIACSRKVPDNIDRAFTSKFMNAREVEWHEDLKGHWLVSFYLEKFKYMTASYTLDGMLDYFELEVDWEDVPKEMMVRVLAAYPNGTIFDVYERNRGNSAEYIFEIVDKGTLFGVDFFQDGRCEVIPSDDYRFTSRIRVGE